MTDKKYYLDRSLGFLLADTSRLMRKRFDRRARALGLTRAQWRVMAFLSRYEGINQTALADVLEIEPITLGRHIDRLQENGWVERRPDPDDRRVWRIFLTDKAQPVLDELEAIAIWNRDGAMAGFSEAERERFIDDLIRIKANQLKALQADAEAEEAEGAEVPARAAGARHG
ncbi:MAG: MarR family transcriptional regulator [Magnetovibrio sp.]|nr:MarR family transcriptional regulator [Magnetovibrio sp.]